MAEEWFYTQNGQQAGPVDFSVIQQMAAGGQIRPGDLIWKQGMANWTAANMVPGVFAAPAAPPPQGYVPPPPAAGAPGYAPPGSYPGSPVMNYGSIPPPSPHLGMARTAMILSLVGILCFGPITGLLGVIFGGIALSGMSKTGDNRGKGMAITGLVVGILDIVFGIMYFAFVFGHRH